MGLLPAALAWVGRLIIDAVTHAAATQSPADRERVLWAVAGEAGLAVVLLFGRRAQNYLRAFMRAKLGNLLSLRLLEKALSLELEQFERSQTYDLLQNARRDVATRPISLALSGLMLARSLVTLLSLGAILADIAWWAVIPLALSVVPEFFIETRLSGEAFALTTGRAQDSRRLGYYESMLTLDSHAKEVKLYGLGPLVLSRYRELFTRFFREDDRLGRRQAVLTLVFAALSSFAFYGCYAAVAWRTALGLLSIGGLTLAVVAFRQGQGAVEDVLASLNTLYDDARYVSNVSLFFDLPASGSQSLTSRFAEANLAGRVTTPVAPRTLPPGRFTIELDHVSFRYPGRETWALRDLSLTLAPGEKLAIVGENGAGKSTLIKLLLRLYEPTEGVIRFGGIDVRELDTAALRKRLGAVFQDFVRYQLTAGENIGLGDLERLGSRAAIEAAAKAGGAEDLLAELPNRTDTVLGNWFEHGHELSGGQWQRLAIARSFMRLQSNAGAGADLLILDEPTAAIDAAAEVALFERFQKLTEGRSAIIISHRFSTVRMADRIALLEHGKLIELGSHDELLAKNGQYAHLFNLQARGYR
ncbi:MAG: ABC transporter ATP-binding protein [Myxococcaceae bacterium]|nr:ABC transporter ATP-binding protein [Myxococcaceae bacterium]